MKKEKPLETILVLVLALIVFYFVFNKPLLLKIGLLLGGIGLFIPSLAAKIHWLWMKLSHVLGYVMSRVLLTLIFYIIVVPMAFFSRLAGKHSINLKRQGNSYFKERNFTYTKESLENVW